MILNEICFEISVIDITATTMDGFVYSILNKLIIVKYMTEADRCSADPNVVFADLRGKLYRVATR